MESKKGKGKKGLIIKTWERCKSIGRGGKNKRYKAIESLMGMGSRSKSCPNFDLKVFGEKPSNKKSHHFAPEGCFSVYVGPQRQRFVIKTEFANHPLFKILLEEAESEYGYNSQGPLILPCDVHIFLKVLMEMDQETDEEIRQGCAFVKRSGSYHLLTPSRVLAINPP
ncbi:auxin-responsive protein SAUR32-like [Neltuma alba]|uniref:auxin-responsive protein SAUR32-like n=1 Tax=Neltuma alba TaxID=207710 RepID=UPI0010A3C38F|nr:auxin-responsive protein SAUR32-like [Prosopis alba]